MASDSTWRGPLDKTALALGATDAWPAEARKTLQRFVATIRRELADCRLPSDAERLAATVAAVIRGTGGAAARELGGPRVPKEGEGSLAEGLGPPLFAVACGFPALDDHRDAMHALLAREVRRRTARMAAEAAVPAAAVARGGPCQLARSAVREEWRSPRGLPPVAAEALLAAPAGASGLGGTAEAQWADVFGKLRDDNELPRERLRHALELAGVAKPNPTWIGEICDRLTGFSALGREEFVLFCEAYERRQRQAYADAFAQCDEDGSGMVEHSELAALLNRFGIEPMRHVLDEVFAEVDTDGQGSLDLEHFEKVMELIHMREGFTKKECETFAGVYRRFDLDRSGEVDTKDLIRILSWLGFQVDHQHVARVVAEVDVDGSGTVNEREFLVCMRRVRDRQLERFEKAVADSAADRGGCVSTRRLASLLGLLGYDPNPAAVAEAAGEVGVTPEDEGLDLGTLWRLLNAYCAREGLSAAERAEVREAFERHDRDCAGEVSTLEVGKMLRWLGFAVPLEVQQELVDRVDVDRSGRVGLGELQKLVRMHHNRNVAAVHEAFGRCCPDGGGTITLEEASSMFQDLGCVNDEGQTPNFVQDDLTFWEKGVGVTAAGMVAAASRFREEARRRLRQNFGFSAGEVREFRGIFRKYDKDRSGDIAKAELIPLIEGAFPALAHDGALRPRLAGLLAAGRGGGPGDGAVDFRAFLRLMQCAQELGDQEKVMKEKKAIEETDFLQDEVKEFRELFLDNCHVGGFELSMEKVIALLCRACSFRTTQIAEFAEIFRGVTRKFAKDDEARQDRCDFPEFLRVMRELLDLDFAGIASAHES